MSELQATIDQIRAWHRKRCFAMEHRIRNYLALGALIRQSLGWSLNLPERERKRIASAAAELIHAPDGEWADVVAATRSACAPYEAIEKEALNYMTMLAVTLPVWETLGASVRGFGAASLAVIVAEAGDLSEYATVSKLWKRMGLAVFDGVRQGGLPKSATAEQWIAHGYNRKRRSRMWNVGDALIKGNRDGEYRDLYLKRKLYEKERNPEIKPIAAHRRAQRYMEKRLLRNLWIAWRRAALGRLQPINRMSPDIPSRGAAENDASLVCRPGASPPSCAARSCLDGAVA